MLPRCPDAPVPHIVGIHAATGAAAQVAPPPSDTTTPSEAEPVLTMFPHSDSTPWLVSGQANIIFQSHPSFHSPYQGTNSLHGGGEYKTSLLGTLYTGVQIGPLFGEHSTRYQAEFIFDAESAGGRGLSEALGLAGFTNLDVVRNPSLGSKPYVAKVQLRGIFGFTDDTVKSSRTPFSLATELPARRLEFRIGKMAIPDMFDINTVLSDSHLQFSDWTVDNNGAWDYAADTRGYTYGALLEYDDKAWSVRYNLALMPTVANGINLDWAISRAHAQNAELEIRHGFLPGRDGVQRFLGYVNDAHMGTYREAVNAYLNGTDPTPDITKHEHFGNQKYGVGYNFEQQVTDHLRAAGRFGWNEGQHESYAYTEVDQTVDVGFTYDGAQWNRKSDKFGVAFNSNAIKRDHQNYLADGGLGFILGDGHLHYGRENIVEAFYNTHSWRGLFFTLGMTHVDNPGYNQDRGPVWVETVRAHVDF